MLSSRSRTARSTSSIKGPLLFVENATSTEYSAGLKRAIEKGWLELRERGLHAQDKRPVSAHLLRLRGPGLWGAVLGLSDRGLAITRVDECFLKLCLLISRHGGPFAIGR
jgi:hypothetical protein